jgi:hypothetical protein
MTYSHAAMKYADSRVTSFPDRSKWDIAAAAFDAGLAARPSPERLADPADPRIRSGAVVSVCFPDREKPESVTYVYLLDDLDENVRSPRFIRDRVRNKSIIACLITEAPDPDAELIPAITLAAVTGAKKYARGLLTWDDLDSRDLVRDFRAVGLAIVRTVKP